jgi:hypothetical protein
MVFQTTPLLSYCDMMPESRNSGVRKDPFLGNSRINIMRLLQHMHRTQEMLAAVFSIRYAPRLYKEGESAVTPNHKNEHLRCIGQGEARHRKYNRLKLSGSEAYDQSSD